MLVNRTTGKGSSSIPRRAGARLEAGSAACSSCRENRRRPRPVSAGNDTLREEGSLCDLCTQSWLADCVRITIGRPADNDLLLRALAGATERRSAERPIDA